MARVKTATAKSGWMNGDLTGGEARRLRSHRSIIKSDVGVGSVVVNCFESTDHCHHYYEPKAGRNPPNKAALATIGSIEQA